VPSGAGFLSIATKGSDPSPQGIDLLTVTTTEGQSERELQFLQLMFDLPRLRGTR
jgi:hypothetical protein